MAPPPTTADMSGLTEQEQKLVKLYGKLPPKKGVFASKALQARKYFDSGDYAMQKAGKNPEETVGTAIPQPENIPHVSPPNGANGIAVNSTSPTNALGASPIKESGLAKDMELAEDADVPDGRL